MNPADPLQQALAALLPNHLPDPVTWWPPALGWWLTTLTLIALITAGTVLVYRRHRRNRYRRAALRESKRIVAAWQVAGNDNMLILDFNRLLKRVALSAWPRETVAALHGNDWLAFLDQTSRCTDFCEGSGQIFGDARYAPENHTIRQAELQQLQPLVERWIRKHHV